MGSDGWKEVAKFTAEVAAGAMEDLAIGAWDREEAQKHRTTRLVEFIA